MNRSVVVALGLALVVADSAIADVGPIPTPSLPKPPSLPSVPSVPVPDVPDLPDLPSVPSVPSVPLVPAPPVASDQLRVPALPSGGTRPAAPSSSRTSSGSTQSVSRAAPSGGGGRAAGPSAAAAAPVAGRRASGRSGRATARAAQAGGDESRAVRRRERRLRGAVDRYRSCLDGLPVLERRVLVLRSGLGPRGPRSRAGVARTLDLSARRVARLERRGLRRLRGLARGGCGGGSVREAETVAPVSVSAPAATGFARVLAAAQRFSLTGPDQIEVKGEQQSSGSGTRGGGQESEIAPPSATPKALPPSGAIVGGRGDVKRDAGFLLVVVALVLLALVAIGFVSEVRRALRPR